MKSIFYYDDKIVHLWTYQVSSSSDASDVEVYFLCPMEHIVIVNIGFYYF